MSPQVWKPIRPGTIIRWKDKIPDDTGWHEPLAIKVEKDYFGFLARHPQVSNQDHNINYEWSGTLPDNIRLCKLVSTDNVPVDLIRSIVEFARAKVDILDSTTWELLSMLEDYLDNIEDDNG